MMEKKRKRQIRNINFELPSPIIEVIFSKLLFFNLPNCRIVCKQWNDLILAGKFDSPISISNLVFAHTFRNLICVELDPNNLEAMRSVAWFNLQPILSSGGEGLSICSSCNGLLCLLIKKISRKEGTKRRTVCILNPMTNECFKLPISKANQKETYFYGLGFSPTTQQYKIARNTVVSDRSGTLIEIFSLGTSHEWSDSKFLPLFISIYNPVYFDGGLYSAGLLVSKEAYVIYRLDVETERIREISFPDDYGDFCHIEDVNGTLYLTTFIFDVMFHVWRMGQDYSWIKAFVIPMGSLESFNIKLIKVYEYGENQGHVLYLTDAYHLFLYHPKSTTKKTLMIMDSVHQIGSINFNSFPKILAGNS